MPLFTHGHALLIGVGGDLPNTETDAAGLAEILTDPERCAYPPQQVTRLLGEAAQRQAILDGLDALAKRTTAEDTVIVYFSGHGYRVELPIVGPLYYLMPHGYDTNNLAQTAIRGDEFQQRLAAIPAQKLLLLLDCCHAGGLDGAKAAGLSFAKAPLPAEKIEQLALGQGRAVIASSRADELSYAGKPYSVFTLALLEALCGDGAARQDGYVRVTDLALHSRERVPLRTQERQHPQLDYERADNFRVAWYAGGDAQPKGLPFPVESIQIEPQPGAWILSGRFESAVSTDGGDAYDLRGATGAVIKPSGPVTQHFHTEKSGQEEKRAADAEESYLRLLRRECNRLPLAEESRNPGEKGQTRAELVNVYVDLQTESRPSREQVFDRLAVPEKDRIALAWQPKKSGRSDDDTGLGEWLEQARMTSAGDDDLKKHPLRRFASDDDGLRQAFQNLTALEAMAATPHLVLLGHPGSGKSTFVNHLAYVCAGGVLGVDPEWRAGLHNAFDAPLFPLRVILRRWSATLNKSSKPGLSLAYAALRAETGLTQDALARRLALPNTLVLFDGLDEAPAANPDDATAPDRRRLIVESVQAFCTAHPSCRVLVTSRVKPYEQSGIRLDDLPVHTLAALDESRIQRFVQNWYAELARIDPERAGRATKAESRLQIALGQRPALAEMAGTPLLLTMLAAVNTWAGLPESRAQLYDKCVEQLLWEWEKKEDVAEGGSQSGRTALGLVDLLREEGVELQRADVERVLWELTFHAHAQSGADTADLPADALRKKLAAIHPKTNGGWAWANRVVGLMRERGGLLVESDDDVFTFPHRSFQEYLAARWLLTDTKRAEKAAELAGSDTWREVILLACGYLTQEGRREEVQALILEVTAGDTFATPESRQRLLTGGMAWLEYNSPPRATGEMGRLLAQAIPPKLTGLMKAADAPPAQRLEAGLILADTFDRLSTGLDVLPPDVDEFVSIAAAAHLGYDFQIGKYPVTNAQYRRFFEAGGYGEDKPWWTAEVKKELAWDENWRKGPRLWDSEGFNRATQPVVGVSWYEAVAYCEWLTGELRRTGEIAQNTEVRLPKEAEWMFVASPPSSSPHTGGVLSLSKEGRAVGSSGRKAGQGGREYAWGDEFEAWRVNAKESGYGQPTPVHMHPGGATPDTGVWDLCGNVWEWGRDNRGSGKMLLGGAYYSGADGVKASSRDFRFPWYCWDLFGFRLVVVPSSHG